MNPMKPIAFLFLLGLTRVALSPTWAANEDAVKKDLAEFQGEWSMVSGSSDGQPLGEDMRKLMKRVCNGDETTALMAGQVYFKAKITIDPLKTPKTIDYEMTEGFTKGKTQLGIYELAGDEFKSCFAAPGAARPGDFTSKPGDLRTLSVWKRDKKTTPATGKD
jgi:uncharacterized protein (TIGR03067 family)